ncbi:MAG TPA: hypothetical protein VJT08_13035 [Terriglobales bacterium]|nr:hypothetical protein [Terriglobales bacterium]
MSASSISIAQGSIERRSRPFGISTCIDVVLASATSLSLRTGGSAVTVTGNNRSGVSSR